MRGPHTRLHGRIPQAGPCSTFRRVVNCRHLLFSELAIQDTSMATNIFSAPLRIRTPTPRNA